MKQMCQRAVLLPGEGLKMMGDKLGEQRRFLPAAPKLDQEHSDKLRAAIPAGSKA